MSDNISDVAALLKPNGPVRTCPDNLQLAWWSWQEHAVWSQTSWAQIIVLLLVDF